LVVAANLLSTEEPYGLLLFTAGDAPQSSFPDLSLFDPPVAQR
jgi:hypothetical protein